MDLKILPRDLEKIIIEYLNQLIYNEYIEDQKSHRKRMSPTLKIIKNEIVRNLHTRLDGANVILIEYCIGPFLIFSKAEYCYCGNYIRTRYDNKTGVHLIYSNTQIHCTHHFMDCEEYYLFWR